MQGDAFDAFLNDAGDLHFSTQRIDPFNDKTGVNNTDFPKLNGIQTNDKNRLSASIKKEPIELLKYIVKNDVPYTDILTANYTVVNGIMADKLDAIVAPQPFTNSSDDKEFRKATLPESRRGGLREHAGVLSTHAWLASFPTTSGNRNRTRIHYLLRQFMAQEVFDLGTPFPNDNAGENPTVNNNNCNSCHRVMDPMAAGFQNFNEANRWRPNLVNNKYTALPIDYTRNTKYYISGDNWFRDAWLPGYGSGSNPPMSSPNPMPGDFAGNDSALQWLALTLTNSSKFSLGAVHFWYKGITGREALKSDPSGDKLKNDAYTMQSVEFNNIAKTFALERYKVRNLLADLMMSEWLSLNVKDPAKSIDWSGVGHLTMLTPSQLNQKLLKTVGMKWSAFDNPYSGDGRSWGGGFDANNVLERPQEYTLEQHSVINQLALASSCNITRTDFNKPQNQRLLFPLISFTPQTDNMIKQNIVHLHKALWGEVIDVNNSEVTRTFNLFKTTLDSKYGANKTTNCAYADANDPQYIGRAWSVVIAYMLTDYKFLYVNNN